MPVQAELRRSTTVSSSQLTRCCRRLLRRPARALRGDGLRDAADRQSPLTLAVPSSASWTSVERKVMRVLGRRRRSSALSTWSRSCSGWCAMSRVDLGGAGRRDAIGERSVTSLEAPRKIEMFWCLTAKPKLNGPGSSGRCRPVSLEEPWLSLEMLLSGSVGGVVCHSRKSKCLLDFTMERRTCQAVA